MWLVLPFSSRETGMATSLNDIPAIVFWAFSAASARRVFLAETRTLGGGHDRNSICQLLLLAE
jgi:hypothetical protein